MEPRFNERVAVGQITGPLHPTQRFRNFHSLILGKLCTLNQTTIVHSQVNKYHIYSNFLSTCYVNDTNITSLFAGQPVE